MGLFVVLLHHPINQLSAAPLRHVEQEGTAFICQCYILLVQTKECNDIYGRSTVLVVLRLYSVHLHFAQAMAWMAPQATILSKQVFSERKTYGIELYGTFSISCIVAHGCV